MRMTMPRALAAAAVIVAALPGAPARLRAQSALSVAEVLELHGSGVSSERIARIAKQYCIAFPMGDSVGRVLGASGVDAALVTALRSACTKVPRVRPADVLVEEDFTQLTRFTAADGLCTGQSGAGGLALENRRPATGCAIPYPLDQHAGPIRLELTVSDLRGTGTGVVVLGFGKDSASWTQHTFAITSAGSIEVGETTNGRFRRVRLLNAVRAIRPGAAADNRLAVEIRGRRASLYVNDERVFAYEPEGRIAGGLSLGVGPRSAVRFRRLIVKRVEVVAAGR